MHGESEKQCAMGIVMAMQRRRVSRRPGPSAEWALVLEGSWPLSSSGPGLSLTVHVLPCGEGVRV